MVKRRERERGGGRGKCGVEGGRNGADEGHSGWREGRSVIYTDGGLWEGKMDGGREEVREGVWGRGREEWDRRPQRMKGRNEREEECRISRWKLAGEVGRQREMNGGRK